MTQSTTKIAKAELRVLFDREGDIYGVIIFKLVDVLPTIKLYWDPRKRKGLIKLVRGIVKAKFEEFYLDYFKKYFSEMLEKEYGLKHEDLKLRIKDIQIENALVHVYVEFEFIKRKREDIIIGD